MNVLNLVRTNTTKFILPMVFNDNVQYTNILKEDFRDTYICDYYRPEYDSKILIVKSENNEPSHTDAELIKIYKNDIDWVYVFDIPEKWMSDYLIIIQGEYTKLSNEYKKKLLHFWDSDEESLLYKMLNIEPKLYMRYKFRLLRERYTITSESLS